MVEKEPKWKTELSKKRYKTQRHLFYSHSQQRKAQILTMEQTKQNMINTENYFFSVEWLKYLPLQRKF